DQDEVDTSIVTSGVSIPVSDPEKAHESLAGPDPEPMKEDQTGSDSGKLHADVLAFIKSQVPTAVDKYLGTKLDDALLKVLERHTADLIEKYSVLPGPESIQNQESEKSPKEIIRIKKEQGEEKQDSTYSIRSTDKVDLEEFDLKSALFKHMNKIKSANRNTANYRLYHALMEALIADEDAMDKEVADKVKDHKRKHDSDDDEDDDDDEGPSAGSNQGRSTKRRRSDSAASGSAQPPPKDDDQSSKKPRESDASATKQHPALTSTGWQITDTRDAGADSSMHRSDPESEHSEQSSDDSTMQDEGNVSDMEDTDNAHIPKVSTTTWFKPIPESERPTTPEPEWTIPPNDFPEPELRYGPISPEWISQKPENKENNGVKYNYATALYILNKVPEEKSGERTRKNKAAQREKKDICYDMGSSFIQMGSAVQTGKERSSCKAVSRSAVAGVVQSRLSGWFRMKEFISTNTVFENTGINPPKRDNLRRADFLRVQDLRKREDFKNLHFQKSLKILFLSIFKNKSSTIATKTDKTSYALKQSTSRGLKCYTKTKTNLERPNWKVVRLGLNELHKFSDGTLTESGKGWTTWFQDLSSLRVPIRAWKLGVGGSEDDRGK
ncbi:hypothetical protein Tco_0511944, partial [Tanacetum coccineum]